MKAGRGSIGPCPSELFENYSPDIYTPLVNSTLGNHDRRSKSRPEHAALRDAPHFRRLYFARMSSSKRSRISISNWSTCDCYRYRNEATASMMSAKWPKSRQISKPLCYLPAGRRAGAVLRPRKNGPQSNFVYPTDLERSGPRASLYAEGDLIPCTPCIVP